MIRDIGIIRNAIFKEGKQVLVRSALCNAWGFNLKIKQGKLKIPSKCPKCHEQRIDWPEIKVIDR